VNGQWYSGIVRRESGIGKAIVKLFHRDSSGLSGIRASPLTTHHSQELLLLPGPFIISDTEYDRIPHRTICMQPVFSQPAFWYAADLLYGFL
jgi:hypothetical protein